MNSDNTPIQPTKQGFNRDSLMVTSLFPGWSIGVVADGVSLRYWSEVAAKIACKEFVSFMSAFLLSNVKKEIPIELLKDEMIKAIVHVNECLISYSDSSGCTFSVEDSGGQTTIVGAIVFPLERQKTNGSCMSGVIVVGTGDSEALIYTPLESITTSSCNVNVSSPESLLSSMGKRSKSKWFNKRKNSDEEFGVC
eukprot:TRINITY_DN10913_c0_g1_i1.p1 TRINITY_DN10913_c0_g1~~TRINITY_DN10913_c0_g1_i1.p1  ORF type:complete len:195 (-),score=26.88 TRINITY_DN10913_c0_g1_i1:430-1014(-)